MIGPGKEDISITVTGGSAFILTAAPGGSNASRISGYTFELTDATSGVELICGLTL